MDSTDKNPLSSNIMLGIILFLALAARLYGINHGLPFEYQSDEKWIVNSAISFGMGDLNPHIFHWPGTTIMYFLFFEYVLFFIAGWLWGTFQSAQDFAELFMRDPSVFYLIGRITIAIIGTATVYLIYRLGKKMYTEKVGIIAAIFFGFNYLTIGIDHIIFPDTPLTFFCVLGMIFIHNIIKEGKTANYFAAGLIIGFAIATKYNGGALVVPLLAAHFLRIRNDYKGWHLIFFDKKIIIAFASVITGFIISCPFCALDFSSFYHDILWQFNRVHAGSFGIDRDNSWRYYFFEGMPNSIGIGLTILSVPSFLYALWRFKNADIVLGIFVLVCFLYFGSWEIGVEKYLLPLLPFLAILSGRFVVEILSLLKLSSQWTNKLLILCILILIAEPFSRGIYNDYLLTQKDTRTQAKEWVENNVREGTKIAIDAGNFEVAKFSPPLNNSIESIKKKYEYAMKNSSEMYATTKQKIGKYLELKIKYHKGKSYNLLRIVPSMDGKIDYNVSLAEFSENKVKYVIVSSFVYHVYEDPIYKKRHPEVAQYYSDFYSSLDRCCDLVKTFYPLTKEGPGPIIKVYKLS